MDPRLLIPAGLLGLLFGLLAGRARARRQPVVHCEFWVYVPKAALPKQDAVVDVMMRGQGRAGTLAGPIGPAEGLLLSHVGTHVGLVLRSKNPSAFRPDLAHGVEGLGSEELEALNNAEALIRVVFVARKPPAKREHLSFTPAMALGYLAVAEGTLVYDVAANVVYLPESFRDAMDRPAKQASSHVVVRWRFRPQGWMASTSGMGKMGLPELEFGPAESDHEALATELVREAAEALWKSGSLTRSLTVAAFNDEYALRLGEPRRGIVSLNVESRSAS